MKRALSLILALVMALTLVACGNKDGGKDDSFVIGITTFSTSTVFSRNAREVLKKRSLPTAVPTSTTWPPIF